MSDSDLSMSNPFLSSSSSDNELEEAFNEWILACQKVDEARSKSSKRRRRRTHVERGREQGEAQSGNDYFSEVSMYTDAKSAELYFHNETQALMSVDVLDTASKNLNTPATNGDSEVQSPANDMEKKVLRAERFGVPLQLSEKEKRNSRAERFGSVSHSDVNSSKELKRKARAERFGLPADSAVDNEEKKKARVARLGSDSKVDSQDEEKRKAKALRSAQSPADSQTNTVGDSEYYGDSEYC